MKMKKFVYDEVSELLMTIKADKELNQRNRTIISYCLVIIMRNRGSGVIQKINYQKDEGIYHFVNNFVRIFGSYRMDGIKVSEDNLDQFCYRAAKLLGLFDEKGDPIVIF